MNIASRVLLLDGLDAIVTKASAMSRSDLRNS